MGIAMLFVGCAGAGGNTLAPPRGADRAGGLVVGIAFSPHPLRAGGPVRWRVRVKNRTGTPRTLTFRTTQRADVILRRAGAIRYRWSEDRFFAPVVSKRRLAAEAKWTFRLTDRLEVRPGRYKLLATIAAQPAVTSTRTLRVEAG